MTTRLVVDTNVFISAALKSRSRPAQVVEWASKSGDLLKSRVTEQQLFDVLNRPAFASLIPWTVKERFKAIMEQATLVTVTERIVACRDHTDDKFLELPVSGTAEFIVSGDADLLVLNPFRAIPIITPASFLQAVAG